MLSKGRWPMGLVAHEPVHMGPSVYGPMGSRAQRSKGPWAHWSMAHGSIDGPMRQNPVPLPRSFHAVPWQLIPVPSHAVMCQAHVRANLSGAAPCQNVHASVFALCQSIPSMGR